jgi:N-methylhydantoinase A
VPAPRLQSRPRADGRRKIYWGQQRRTLEAPCFDRHRLKPGDGIRGPALIIEAQTTTLVGPEFSAIVDRIGNIVINSVKKGGGKTNGE